MRVLACGGRDYSDKAEVCRVLKQLQGNRASSEMVLIHGCARGADSLAERYAVDHGWTNLRFPADWRAHGKAAGPVRNRQMLSEGKPDVVVAFPGGRGTRDMVAQANAAGVHLFVVPPTQPPPKGGG